MRRKLSGYPIGAKWQFIDKSGKVGVVWLAEIKETFEVWRWSVSHSDGSGHKFDWTTNKAGAVAECSSKFREKTRFKRVKSTIKP